MADLFWGEGGSDAASGLSYANRRANISALTISPGDVVYQCAAAAGLANRWTCTQQINVVSGTAGNLVTYRVYPAHHVLMEVSTSGTNGAINGSGNSYFRIEPGDGFLTLGDNSDWDPDNWTAPGWRRYAARRQLNFVNCNNFQLVGTGTGVWSTTNSNFVIHGGSSYEGNTFDSNCSMFIVRGLDVSDHGTNNTGTFVENPSADDGDMFCLYGNRMWIDRCCFARGGHQNIAIKGVNYVVTDCDFDGDWTGYTPNADAGRGAPTMRSGSRAFHALPGDAVHGGVAPYGPGLVENCIMQRAGSAGDEYDNAGAKLDGNHLIFRMNYIWDGVDAALVTATHDDFTNGSVSYVKVYNITTYGNGRIYDIRTIDVFASMYAQMDFINNICDEIRGAYYQSATVRSFRRRATGEAADGYPNGWKGGRYEANIARMASTAPEGSNVVVEFRNFGGSVEVYNWDTVDNTYSQWASDNVMGTAPTYQGNPAGGDRTTNAFLPGGGIETGNAAPHAYANGSGASATSLTVDSGQARMFFDGWGMTSLGLSADWIKIGSGDPVQISSINYGTDVITLASARSWSDNDEIYLALTDDGGATFTIVQDIGAGQTAIAAPTPNPPVYSSAVMVMR